MVGSRFVRGSAACSLPTVMMLAALGCAESLNNLVLALILTVATTLLALAGVVRAVRMPASERR